MRSIIVIIVVLISLPGLSQESGKDILPKNAFDAGIIAITLNGNGGFYFEYLMIDEDNQTDPDKRISIGPVAMIGYSLIFWNRIHMNMQAGGGLSFRLAGETGKVVEPIAVAGIGLGVRF